MSDGPRVFIAEGIAGRAAMVAAFIEAGVTFAERPEDADAVVMNDGDAEVLLPAREYAKQKLADAPRVNPYPNHPAPPNRAERFMQRQIEAAERRKKLDAANTWRSSSTDFNAQAKAAAKSKRERKAARRLSLAQAQLEVR